MKKLEKDELERIYKDHLDMLGGAKPGLIKTGLIILIYLLFKPPLWILIGLFLVFQVGWGFMDARRNHYPKGWMKKMLKNAAYTIVYVSILVFLHILFGPWGWAGFFLIIALMTVVVVVRRWKFIMAGKHTVERIIWGETLRERWEREQGEKYGKVRGDRKKI